MPRIVYSNSFVNTVKPPEEWDRRPLPNLLHRARDPVTRDQELDRLERWYEDRNVAVNIRQSIVPYGHADPHTTDPGL